MCASRFVAIDFETANASLASICQVGIVVFQDGQIQERWSSLVDPEEYFDDMNVYVHGIDERKVRGAPTLPQIFDEISRLLDQQIVVSHTSFDRTAFAQAVDKYGLSAPECEWLDSARVVRRIWKQWAYSGYGLSNVCHWLGIDFIHHDAVEDARAAGEILLRAMAESGFDLEGLKVRLKKPIDENAAKISLSGNPDGLLAGEDLVFTGALAMTRREAAEYAAKMGCNVSDSVKKTTTILVVGDQDICKLHGHEKSSKHRKAETLITQGKTIRILGETDFLRMVNLS